MTSAPGVLASAAAAFFYVRIIVLMFFTAPAGADADGAVAAAASGQPTTTVVASEGFALVAIAICAVLTVLLGVVPGPVLDLVTEAAKFIP